MSKSLETATQLHLSLVASGVRGPPVMEFVATVSKKGSNEDPRVVSVETGYLSLSAEIVFILKF